MGQQCQTVIVGEKAKLSARGQGQHRGRTRFANATGSLAEECCVDLQVSRGCRGEEQRESRRQASIVSILPARGPGATLEQHLRNIHKTGELRHLRTCLKHSRPRFNPTHHQE